MRYCGARAIAFAMKAAWAAVSSFGAGVVRVATEVPTSAKKFSWPAGAANTKHANWLRAGIVELMRSVGGNVDGLARADRCRRTTEGSGEFTF